MRPPLCRLALALALAGPAIARATGLDVALTVDEPAGVARRTFPATASVPLPRGRLEDPGTTWLARPDGSAVPSQARALDHWPDGSVRWLFLDFLADVPAGGLATYRLRTGKAAHAPTGPRVRLETAGAARTLDSGSLRVVVSGGGAMIDELAGGAAKIGPLAAPRLIVEGLKSEEPAPGDVEVETEGPVRTELLVTGRYPQGFVYEARVAAFAGQPFVRLQVTLTSMVDRSFSPLRRFGFFIPATVAAGEFGIDGAAHRVSASTTHALRHDDATPALLDGTAAGVHGDGWVRARAGNAALTLVRRYAWQEYPQQLSLSGDGVGTDLLSGAAAPIRFGTGAAKTFELWIALEPLAGASAPDRLATMLTSPLIAIPSAAWIVQTRALPQAIEPAGPGARDFLTRLTTAFARYRAGAEKERWDDGLPVPCPERKSEHPRLGFYGAFNWGDWNFPGYRDHVETCDGWGNLEYDLPQVLGLAFLATGSRAYFDGFVPAARHYRDVDVMHHAPGHPDWVGLNHPHKVLHFAMESPTKVDLGHTWTEGLLTHYRLTGEVRSLAAARGIADALLPLVGKAGNPRQLGWPMLALTAVYDATGDRRYRDGAVVFAEAALGRIEPTPASGDWKMGILADGIAAVHAMTNDQRLRRWLVSYADALLPEIGRYADARYALPLGYVATITGEPRYAAVGQQVVRTMKIGEWGKPLAATGRTGFRILAPLATKPPTIAPPLQKAPIPAKKAGPRR
jgi:hypothetical protein